uniref:Apoptosis enhancing nuclease n=1 Tax=Myotis myotis TaxID=51298 RepID=A0A7J7RRZ1_MYOMY|nr:apoptosis enhancing nuclease [Myotis myotis]
MPRMCFGEGTSGRAGSTSASWPGRPCCRSRGCREPASSPPPGPSGAPPGTEAASRGRQARRADSGGGPCGRKPSPREAAGPLPSRCVAIDCEMVGTGPCGRVSELARCSVVSYHGDVLYDKYIRPEMPIVDYRTRWSGITRQHMRKAIPFQAAQKEILKLLKGKVVVGHALHNDFRALKYVHPRSQTRDTTYVPNLLSQPGLQRGAGGDAGQEGVRGERRGVASSQEWGQEGTGHVTWSEEWGSSVLTSVPTAQPSFQAVVTPEPPGFADGTL